MSERLTGATADALRAETDRCLPGRTWCLEGAKLRDLVDSRRDAYVLSVAEGKPHFACEIRLTTLILDVGRLADHVRRCGREES